MRRAMVDGDVVDCMVAFPPQLFYSVQIPVCVWLLARNKNPGKGFRDRRGQVLFIDARKLGNMATRVHRVFDDVEINHIARVYHAWRGEASAGTYEDIDGFCKSSTIDEIANNSYVLTPGRYVGAEEVEDDDEVFEEKMYRLVSQLSSQLAAGSKLDQTIVSKLTELGYDI